jgi:hypothetical protein
VATQNWTVLTIRLGLIFLLVLCVPYFHYYYPDALRNFVQKYLYDLEFRERNEKNLLKIYNLASKQLNTDVFKLVWWFDF